MTDPPEQFVPKTGQTMTQMWYADKSVMPRVLCRGQLKHKLYVALGAMKFYGSRFHDYSISNQKVENSKSRTRKVEMSRNEKYENVKLKKH